MDVATMLNFAGLAGAVLYLVAYFLLQAGIIGGNSNTYTITNMVAAALVLTSLFVAFNAAVLLINVSWISISIYGLGRVYLANRRVRFSDEEQAFVDAKLPGLKKHQARQILNKGLWVSGDAGDTLITQGVQNKNLVYLAAGEAEIDLNGQHITTVGSGSYLGEMTFETGDVATATAKLSGPPCYLCLNAEALRKLCKQDPEIAKAIEASFAHDMRSKIVAANSASAKKVSSAQVGEHQMSSSLTTS